MPKNTTALIVEDTPEVLEILTEVLQNEGYKVRQACRGADGVEIIREMQARGQKLDRLIVDLHCPHAEDGDQVIATAKALFPDCRSLLISGATELNHEDVRQKGADGFLKKPFFPLQLIQALMGAPA